MMHYESTVEFIVYAPRYALCATSQHRLTYYGLRNEVLLRKARPHPDLVSPLYTQTHLTTHADKSHTYKYRNAHTRAQ